jgi:predicted dehydrogenase
MKVLIMGLGSIGQRWARLLKDNFDSEIHALRRRNHQITIEEDLQSTRLESPASKFGIIEHFEKAAITSERFDLAIISSPIATHLEDLLTCIEIGIPKVLIEKPMFAIKNHQWRDTIEKITKHIETGKFEILVGFQSRFHPALLEIKRILRENQIGLPLYVRNEYAEYLPSMHPYEDYRNSHMGKREEGGGPILCLSHEIDLIQNLFGDVSIEISAAPKFSQLETNVPDSVLLSWRQTEYSSGVARVCGDIYLDFLSTPNRRKILITGTEGTLEFDWITGKLQVLSLQIGYIEMDFSTIERDSLFVSELKYLLQGKQLIEKQKQEIARAIQIAELSDQGFKK